MRTRIMLALWAGWTFAGGAAAQTIPTPRVIAQDVEVRSGPSLAFYATSKLKAGEQVSVRRELTDQPGWLEIAPPSGSFSWIDTMYLTQSKQDSRQWFVSSDAQPKIIVGSSVEGSGAPTKEAMALPRGAQVFAVGAPREIAGHTWLPITPYVGESRYIPKTAVQETTSSAKMNGPANWILTPQNMYTTDPLLAEAQKRDAANDRAGALQYYQQVYSNPNSDPNSRVLAQKAIARLQQSGVSAVQGTTTSLSPAQQANAGLNLQTLKAPEWTAYGRLHDIKMTTEDGQAIYALEDTNGRPLTYVSTAPGKSLQTYMGRWISVYGPTMYRTGSRMPYVVVSHVASP